jgi:hypothetical protein
MALVRTVDVTELKPQPRENVAQSQRHAADRLRASLGERSLAKQLDRAEARRRARGLRP